MELTVIEIPILLKPIILLAFGWIFWKIASFSDEPHPGCGWVGHDE